MRWTWMIRQHEWLPRQCPQYDVNNGQWKKEQRLSGSRDAVWMTKLVRQMKSGTAEESNEREIEYTEKLYLWECYKFFRETISTRVFINSL